MRLGLLANNNNNKYELAHLHHTEAITLAHDL
jgi:hypothetical protein